MSQKGGLWRLYAKAAIGNVTVLWGATQHISQEDRPHSSSGATALHLPRATAADSAAKLRAPYRSLTDLPFVCLRVAHWLRHDGPHARGVAALDTAILAAGFAVAALAIAALAGAALGDLGETITAGLRSLASRTQ